MAEKLADSRGTRYDFKLPAACLRSSLMGYLPLAFSRAQGRLHARRRLLRSSSSALGLGYALIDLLDARAQKQAIAEITDLESRTPKWFVGHWGFQFYAERAGMQPVVPGKSMLVSGDYLIVPDAPIDQQKMP